MSQSSKVDEGKSTVPLLTVNDGIANEKENQNRDDSRTAPTVYNVAEHLLHSKDKSPCGVSTTILFYSTVSGESSAT